MRRRDILAVTSFWKSTKALPFILNGIAKTGGHRMRRGKGLWNGDGFDLARRARRRDARLASMAMALARLNWPMTAPAPKCVGANPPGMNDCDPLVEDAA